MRYISIFSGIEAASVAWSDLGWEPVAFAEVEPFPCELLKQRFPDVPNLGDVTQIDWSEYAGSVDLIVGGSPCQSFSVAGNREGLEGESVLMFEYIRAVRDVMPRYFIWENVPGALSSEEGAAFGQLLSEMDELGYGLAGRVLDAQFFGVAQRRRRVFLVGSLGTMRAAEILFEPESLRWDYPSSRDKRQELTAASARCPRASYSMLVRCGRGGGGKGPLVQDDVSATLSTSNLQTIFQPLGFAYNAGGKAASCGAAEEISPTLRSSSHGEHGVCYSIAGNIINRRANNGGNGDGFNEEVSCTLNTIDRHAVCFQQNQRDEVRLMSGYGSVAGAISAAPGMKNTNYLCVADDNAKAAIDEDVCGTLKVGGGSPLIAYQRSQDLCAPEILRESAPNTSKRAR